jgi:hypothetical protein
MSTWREKARKVIVRVLEETRGMDEAAVKKALHDAYPFGIREHHPYKIWRDEIKVQTGKRRLGQKKEKPNPDQQSIF